MVNGCNSQKMIKFPLNVTIDTNVFESNKFDFGADSTIELIKKNVQNNKIKLVLSDVVINEVEKHICQRAGELCKKAKNLRKDFLKTFSEHELKEMGLDKYIEKVEKEIVCKNAKEIFKKFLEECNVERLNVNSVNLEKVLDDYFAINPPFEISENKKKEFPDAFIVEEIKKRFGNMETVAIVSQDKGLKKALEGRENYLFFSTLGELFDSLNKSEEEYHLAYKTIIESKTNILQKVEKMITDDYIEVRGLAFDHEGISYGYNYDDAYLVKKRLTNIVLHTIDDIDNKIITASLWVFGDIDVHCCFKDYDNALWDSEEKEYIYVDVKHILEKHKAKFACRVEIHKETKKINILPFKIILGGDSRKSRTEIYNNKEEYCEEFENTERKEYGFLPLSQYRNNLENSLSESSMAQEIVKLFKQYNDISSKYEKLVILYDEIHEKISNGLKEEESIKKFLFENGINKEGFKIEKWIDEKCEMISRKAENHLPDYIEYGKSFIIVGKNEKKYTLFFDELHDTPEAGSQEQINVELLSNKKIIARGFVILTVGYLEFDEDGGIVNGIKDNIDYEVSDILESLEKLILSLKKEYNEEDKLAVALKEFLK